MNKIIKNLIIETIKNIENDDNKKFQYLKAGGLNPTDLPTAMGDFLIKNDKFHFYEEDNRFDYEYGSIQGIHGTVDFVVEGNEGITTLEYITVDEGNLEDYKLDENSLSFNVPYTFDNEYDSNTIAIQIKAKIINEQITPKALFLNDKIVKYYKISVTLNWEITGEYDELKY